MGARRQFDTCTGCKIGPIVFPSGCVFVLTLQEGMQLLDVLVVVCRVTAVEGDFRCVRKNHQTCTQQNKSIITNQTLKIMNETEMILKAE